MAQYSNLKAYIEEKIYENGTQAITGDILQDVLKVMTDDLGEFYQMGGVASPSTDPGTPDAKVIYIATEAGTYTNFGGITLAAGEVALLIFETSWTKETLNVLSSANGGVKTANLADGAVTTEKIAGGAVETAKIANNAVTSGKVADGAIGTAKIADGAIGADKIAANAVESAKIKNGAVTEGKINDGAVTAGKVAANAVTTAKIADDAVTTAKLNDGAVTEDKIATDAVTSGKVKDGAIGTAKIAAGAVTHAKIGAGAVDESNIKDGAVTSDKIANGAVGSDQLAEGAFSAENLADGSVTTDKLADKAVTAEKIADGAVTADKFANGSVTTIKLGSGAVTTEKIGDGMVTRQKLADSSVGTSKIIDGAVTTDKVADGAITDAKLENPVSVSQNTETGHADIKIGGEIFPVASVEEVSQLGQKIDGKDVYIDANETTPDYYRRNDGGVASLSGFFYSDPIKVEVGDKFTANSVSANSAQTNIAMLSWVDENNNFISLILNPNGAGTYEYTFLQDGFVCISGYSNDMSKFSIFENGAINDIEELKNDVKNIENTINGETIGISNDIISGKYRYNSGALISLSGFFYSDPIKVEVGDKFIANSVSGDSAQTNIAMLSWVDENNNFISLILNPNGAGTYEYTFTQSGYVCISGHEDDLTKFTITKLSTDEKIDILLDGQKDLDDKVNGKDNSLSNDDIVSGKYRSRYGTVGTLSGFFYSDPIPVNGGDKFIANSVSGDSAQTNIAMLSWVDENNNFISLILNPNGAGTYEYTFNKSGYISISGYGNDLGKFTIKIGDIDVHIGNLSDRVEELENDSGYDSVRLPKLTTNPIEEINYNCGLVGIFKTMGVIGDSLASGEMQGNHNDGTLYYRDMYEFSWGQQIAKMTGVDVFNFSNGGQYAKGWMNGNTERTWDANDVAGGAHSNKKQCYLIGFAHNDKTMVDNNTYTAGIGTIADINDSDYTQNADSFVGWYARIIQALKTIEPRAFIFCITPPSSVYDSYSAQIRDIVTHFSGNRVYLIDLRQYGMAWNNALLSMGNHLSSAGYLYYAYEIANYMDWIIRNNPNDFKYASLVGTDILDTNPNP